MQRILALILDFLNDDPQYIASLKQVRTIWNELITNLYSEKRYICSKVDVHNTNWEHMKITKSTNILHSLEHYRFLKKIIIVEVEISELILSFPLLESLQIEKCNQFKQIIVRHVPNNLRTLKVRHCKLFESNLHFEELLHHVKNLDLRFSGKKDQCTIYNPVPNRCCSIQFLYLSKSIFSSLFSTSLFSSSLVHLDLYGNEAFVSDSYVQLLASYCKSSLKRLILSGCKQITNKGISALRKCTQLTSLHLWWCNQISEIVPLEEMHDLEVLNLNWISLQQSKQLEVIIRFPMLHTLLLSKCYALHDELLIKICTTCKKLHKLDISYSNITDKGIQYGVAKLQELEEVNFSHCTKLSDEAIQEASKEWKKLCGICMSGTLLRSWKTICNLLQHTCNTLEQFDISNCIYLQEMRKEEEEELEKCFLGCGKLLSCSLGNIQQNSLPIFKKYVPRIYYS